MLHCIGPLLPTRISAQAPGSGTGILCGGRHPQEQGLGRGGQGQHLQWPPLCLEPVLPSTLGGALAPSQTWEWRTLGAHRAKLHSAWLGCSLAAPAPGPGGCLSGEHRSANQGEPPSSVQGPLQGRRWVARMGLRSQPPPAMSSLNAHAMSPGAMSPRHCVRACG